MPAWIRAMLATPDEPETPLCRYTRYNGYLYMALGAGLYLWPGAGTALGGDPLQGQEAGLLRVIGLTVGLIGWFYVFGARTNRDSFGLATVADRAAVPALLLPLALSGAVDPMLLLPFAILDPLLALGAWWVWSRSR